ncbi:hypothetical protein APZ24_gp101 [Ostreococcus lucimarinus virus 2]|jgi:hypothetical protein|uniref:hypothetical protein n=1 Tax=Ostreococcus tauri virus 2 TaxID=696472 RepID=UPI0001EF4833|nr:hypothetical protein OtV2_095 [Ostreococcus tauri virus 2]YP_007674795.1 hypothetical protein OLNG_00153 [Ostreococcus lucimarinus virus OlV5]YP_009172592.1 hypothetical protein APZ24_gp101 [Ostreococcus lucimarinus virus 2]AFK65904.1 hypothetical protein OLVG_00150 [Ostreococcus lucimarinus virus OlV6]AGH31226.1 hypothetical protein OLNG_00153 [Ostreococcus lucimarinus virus OlV5]ALI95464.1 hypothetical protein OlV2_101c [Ostreococcus lucimarinus virus 2]CBI70094.1 hypothetical protein Ot|tara:strand:- start:390 stop:611 length:222 start_codon:yes stop_codon:yes gene_type:complete
MEDLSEYLRDPMSAALIAAAITAGYIHLKAQLNNEGKLELNKYTKPAVLNAILVYFIVANGLGQREAISNDPF